MSVPADAEPARGISRRAVEITVSLILIGLAGLVLYDSYGRGAGWDGGPQNGFFPARVGWIFLAVSGFILYSAFRQPDAIFVTWPQISLVAKVFLPLVLFVALIRPLGVYTASALFIIVFMAIVGGSKWWTILLTAILAPLACFWLFEVQFLVPLPKGFVEAWFGY